MSGDGVSGNGVGAGDAGDGQPLLRVVGGNPSDEEVAALLAVLVAASSAAASAAPSADTRPRELWGDVSERLRTNPPSAPTAFTNEGRWRR